MLRCGVFWRRLAPRRLPTDLLLWHFPPAQVTRGTVVLQLEQPVNRGDG